VLIVSIYKVYTLLIFLSSFKFTWHIYKNTLYLIGNREGGVTAISEKEVTNMGAVVGVLVGRREPIRKALKRLRIARREMGRRRWRFSSGNSDRQRQKERQGGANS